MYTVFVQTCFILQRRILNNLYTSGPKDQEVSISLKVCSIFNPSHCSIFGSDCDSLTKFISLSKGFSNLISSKHHLFWGFVKYSTCAYFYLLVWALLSYHGCGWGYSSFMNNSCYCLDICTSILCNYLLNLQPRTSYLQALRYSYFLFKSLIAICLFSRVYWILHWLILLNNLKGKSLGPHKIRVPCIDWSVSLCMSAW